jgi:hypothetical protein
MLAEATIVGEATMFTWTGKRCGLFSHDGPLLWISVDTPNRFYERVKGFEKRVCKRSRESKQAIIKMMVEHMEKDAAGKNCEDRHHRKTNSASL